MWGLRIAEIVALRKGDCSIIEDDDKNKIAKLQVLHGKGDKYGNAYSNSNLAIKITIYMLDTTDLEDYLFFPAKQQETAKLAAKNLSKFKALTKTKGNSLSHCIVRFTKDCFNLPVGLSAHA